MKRVFGIGLVSLLAAGAVSAQGTPNTYTCKVGNYEVILLSEGQQTGNPGILIDATPEMIEKTIPDGTFPNATNAFLVKTPTQHILFDTGNGRELFDNLAAVGVTPEQIDAVVLTHMHGDHIGGMLRDGQHAFRNAEIYIPRFEYDYWTSDEEMNRMPENRRSGFLNARRVMEAYYEKLHLFVPGKTPETAEALIPGIRSIGAYGHTPGHTAYLLSSGNDKMLIWGDLTHAMAIQIPYPNVAVTYDVDPGRAVASRIEILKFVARNNIPVAGMHIAFPGIGTLHPNPENGYFYTPVQCE